MKALRVFTAACIAFIAVCAAAHAQQVPLQAGPWVSGRVPMYSQSGGTQPIIQDGGSAAGGAIGANIAEMGITARGTGTPPYDAQGHGPNGENFCNYDAPTTNATGYHYLCMSPNVGGDGLISYGSAGTATPGDLNLSINGTEYQFPFVLSGVVGPATSTVGHAATWANTSGTLLADPGLLGSDVVGFTQSGTGAVTRTLQSKERDYVNVSDFMTTAQIADVQACTFTLDTTAAIQAAINSLPTRGGDVHIGPGCFRVDSTITIGNGSALSVSTRNGVHLVGAGIGYGITGFSAPFSPTRIKKYGTGAAISVNGPLVGWGIENIGITFDASATSTYGMIVTSASFGEVRNFQVISATNAGLIQTTIANRESTQNSYDNLYIFMPSGSANAEGIVITGTGTNGSFFNSWRNVFIQPAAVATHIGLDLQFVDSDTFWNLRINDTGGTSAIGIQFNYTATGNEFPTNNTFYSVDTYNNTINNAGSPVASNQWMNRIFGLLTANASIAKPPNPSLANLSVVNDYLNGTFTPTFTGLTIVGAATATGSWVKNGTTVEVWIKLTPTGAGTTASAGGGAVFVNNLPYAAVTAFPAVLSAAGSGLDDIPNGNVQGASAFFPAWTARNTTLYFHTTYQTAYF